MTGTIVVPTLTLLDSSGSPDVRANRAYAARACRTWVDRFLICGSTSRGDTLTHKQRTDLVDLWLDTAGADRIVACCWQPEDVSVAVARSVSPMVVMRGHATATDALAMVASLPTGALIYSHPMFGSVVFDSDFANRARAVGELPAGGKIAKVSVDELRRLRHVVGQDFALWDGSSRHIAQSMAAGASGVVATPLCIFPDPFPSRAVNILQRAVTEIQDRLDLLPTREARRDSLLDEAVRGVSAPDDEW
jgi:dihydrodipicolinate synthase/N-acetylneuraminate lyase